MALLDTGQIRQVGAEERLAVSVPLQAYAFFASPPGPGGGRPMEDLVPYLDGNLTLAIEHDGTAIAEVSVIPMRQNVRGLVCDLAGVSGAATHPLLRRRGHAHALLVEALGRAREMGCAVSALYPFRPSFYQRLGYIGLPKNRTVTFPPAGLGPLLAADVPGKITMQPVADGYRTYREFIHRVLAERHGFAVLPEFRASRLRDMNDRWLATVRIGDRVTAVMLYRITGFDADLVVDVLLTSGVASRTVLLQYLAQHVEQVARIVLPLAPGDVPELWATDLETTTEARITLPGSPAPMARVLSLPALAGLPTGTGRVTVRVIDDPFLAGDHLLDGGTGHLEVAPGADEPDATLTAAGLSGLIYGVLDPDEVVVRGLGTVPPAAAVSLRALFPPRIPHFTVGF